MHAHEQQRADGENDEADELDDVVQARHDLRIDFLLGFRLGGNLGSVILGADVLDAGYHVSRVDKRTAHQRRALFLRNQVALAS